MKDYNCLILFLLIPILSIGQLTIEGTSNSSALEEISIIHQPLYKINFPFSKVDKSNDSFLMTCQSYNGKSATAFFCRMEDRLEKKVKLPIRMRLGTLDYVDQLEQKRTDNYREAILENFSD